MTLEQTVEINDKQEKVLHVFWDMVEKAVERKGRLIVNSNYILIKNYGGWPIGELTLTIQEEWKTVPYFFFWTREEKTWRWTFNGYVKDIQSNQTFTFFSKDPDKVEEVMTKVLQLFNLENQKKEKLEIETLEKMLSVKE